MKTEMRKLSLDQILGAAACFGRHALAVLETSDSNGDGETRCTKQ
jgi:hypothetical protein